MNRLLRHPVTNAVCVSIFSSFYALVFILASRLTGLVWMRPFAYALLALTAVIVVLLVARRRPYDEYHTSVLIQCLAVSLILTLAAIAVFFLMILADSGGVVEKFTVFIAIHWSTVVLADLVYVLLCRWR